LPAKIAVVPTTAALAGRPRPRPRGARSLCTRDLRYRYPQAAALDRLGDVHLAHPRLRRSRTGAGNKH